MKPIRALCTLGLVAMMTLHAFADDEEKKEDAAPAGTPPTVEAQTVLEGLDNPCAVAIQPETGDVFVSDSGAGRIIRVVDGKAQDVIVDFPKDIYGKGPMYNIGPLGLGFISKDILVVGGGGQKDGDELLRVYKVPEKGAEPIKADAMEAKFQLAATDDIKGEGNFYAVAVGKDAVYVTANGDDTKGWVARAKINGTKVEGFERFLATKEKTEVDAPVGITMHDLGYIVVGQMGEITVPGDSLLTFYDDKGEMLMNLETGLSDITAVAYSTQPRGTSNKKQLYVLDFCWNDTTQGGLFQLVADGDDGVEARKKTSLDKPTSMAFTADGSLYITVLGTAEEGSDAKSGKLLKVAPGL